MTEVILPLLSCRDLIVAELRSILEISHINFDMVSSILDCCKNPRTIEIAEEVRIMSSFASSLESNRPNN